MNWMHKKVIIKKQEIKYLKEVIICARPSDPCPSRRLILHLEHRHDVASHLQLDVVVVGALEEIAQLLTAHRTVHGLPDNTLI
jgi:hypothetical protein